jgi:hypothetical protein
VLIVEIAAYCNENTGLLQILNREFGERKKKGECCAEEPYAYLMQKFVTCGLLLP